MTDNSKSKFAEYYDIKTMSDLCGVSQRVLRLFDERGLLSASRVNSRLQFSGRDHDVIKVILACKRFGIGLGEIENVLKDSSVVELSREQDVMLVVAKKIGGQKILDYISLFQKRREDIDAAIAELKAELSRRSAAMP